MKKDITPGHFKRMMDRALFLGIAAKLDVGESLTVPEPAFAVAVLREKGAAFHSIAAKLETNKSLTATERASAAAALREMAAEIPPEKQGRKTRKADPVAMWADHKRGMSFLKIADKYEIDETNVRDAINRLYREDEREDAKPAADDPTPKGRTPA